jgi:integrase/recombinase XerC
MDWERHTYTPGLTKGREADPVPLPDWLRDYLAPVKQPAGLIVVNVHGNTCRPGFMRQTMLSANAVCGIDGLTPHRLRGTFATLLSEQGLPIQTIQRVMRHKDPLTTMRYLEANLAAAVSAQASIARIAGLQSKPEPSGPKMATDTMQTHME